MIEERFVSFDTARMLKEAGFDELCCYGYDKDGNKTPIGLRNSTIEGMFNRNGDDWFVSAPTQALAARFLRETHNIHVFPFFEYARKKWCYGVSDTTAFYAEEGMDMPDECFLSCEEAFEAGLHYGLKLIKK